MANLKDVDDVDYVRIKDKIYYVQSVSYKERYIMAVPAEDISLSDNDQSLEQKAVRFSGDAVNLIKPAKVSGNIIRSLFRLERTPWELALNHQYPFNPETGLTELHEEDILAFIDNVQTIDNRIWLIAWMQYFFYNDEAQYVYVKKPDAPGFTLRYLWERVQDAVDWFEYLDEARDNLLALKECYLQSKGRPLLQTVIPPNTEYCMLDDLEQFAKGHPVTEEIREYYDRLLEALLKRWDPDEIRRYAYTYYGGNAIAECNWEKSEQGLLKLFSLDDDPPKGDPYAANSLGYIYYSDRLGKPDYDKAFRCFSYAAEAGVIEATYKLSDMYRKGHGTVQDSEKAWNLLNELYSGLDPKHPAKNKYPDIALRIGYCYRDGVGVSRNNKRAKEYFLLAKNGIELRLKKHPGFGDEVVARNINKALEDIEQRILEENK